jgi:AcrR family transcriptional regulator
MAGGTDMTAPMEERPLRADARRNRALLLEAAERVVAARGVSASTEEVARAAGVGVGTLFRHFPTKEALLEAVYRARLGRLAEQARELATAADAGAAFFDFFRRVVAQSTSKVAIADALAEVGIDVRTSAAEAGHDLSDALTTLLVRAQHAHAVRPDIGIADLMAVLVGASRAVEHAATDDVRGRLIDIVLDGLRPPSPH